MHGWGLQHQGQQVHFLRKVRNSAELCEFLNDLPLSICLCLIKVGYQTWIWNCFCWSYWYIEYSILLSPQVSGSNVTSLEYLLRSVVLLRFFPVIRFILLPFQVARKGQIRFFRWLIVRIPKFVLFIWQVKCII